MSIECPNYAYYKIVNNSEIYNKILEKKEVLYHLFLHRSLYDEEGNTKKIFEKAKKIYFDENRKISPQSETFKKILELENEFQKEWNMMPEKFKELLIKYPFFIGQVVLGDEIFNYKKYSFSYQKSLEESLTSFCISEQHILGRNYNEYIWRNKNMKNTISLNTHGNLYASQCDVSGKSRIEKTLFGEDLEIFDTIKKLDYEDYSGISAHQDWSQFLVSLLKYAEYLGKKDIPEIVNWQEVLKKAGGGRGTSTAESFGGTYNKYDLERLMETPVLNDKIEKLEDFSLEVYSQNGNSIPRIENNNLLYLRENEHGEVSLEKFSHIYKNKKFSIALEYCEEDLPHALTATYKYFARDRSILPKIMNYFLISGRNDFIQAPP